jgi:hypothetical protein
LGVNNGKHAVRRNHSQLHLVELISNLTQGLNNIPMNIV